MKLKNRREERKKFNEEKKIRNEIKFQNEQNARKNCDEDFELLLKKKNTYHFQTQPENKLIIQIPFYQRTLRYFMHLEKAYI